MARTKFRSVRRKNKRFVGKRLLISEETEPNVSVDSDMLKAETAEPVETINVPTVTGEPFPVNSNPSVNDSFS